MRIPLTARIDEQDFSEQDFSERDFSVTPVFLAGCVGLRVESVIAQPTVPQYCL